MIDKYSIFIYRTLLKDKDVQNVKMDTFLYSNPLMFTPVFLLVIKLTF